MSVDYLPSDLLEPASFEAHQAAVYDYVAAVYGDGSAGYFDCDLSAQEREYVELHFGSLTAVSDTKVYLSNAKQVFFDFINTRKVHEDFRCDSLAQYFSSTQNQHPIFGSAYVFAGAHGCGERFSEMYSEVELQIAAHPENWVFFVEGASATAILGEQYISSKETVLLEHIAQRLDIPLEDSVAQLFDPIVLEALQNDYGLAPTMTAVYTCAASSIERFKRDKPGTSEDYLKIIELQAKGFAKAFSMDPKVLTEETQKFVGQGNEFVDPRIKRFIEAYKDVSNRLSPEKIKRKLTEHGKSNALFQLGANHTDITNQVYKSE